MISTLHGLYDDRIYWKEALSLNRNGFHVIHVGLGDTDSDELSPHGIRLISISRDSLVSNPFFDILLKRLLGRRKIYDRLLTVCAQLKADSYHYHDVQVNRIAGRLKQLPHRPVVVYDVHEDYPDLVLTWFPRAGILRFLSLIYSKYLAGWERRRSKPCDAIITVVEHLRERFAPLRPAGRTELIFNYTTLFPESLDPLQNRQFDALYSGQISLNRGAMQLLEASRLVVPAHPAFRMLLIGPIPDSQLYGKMRTFIDRHGLGSNVTLHEPVPYSRMEEFFRNSRIGLGVFLPVSIFMYGIQVKTFEYMAYGLPLVCSHTGTISRIVTENGAGLVCNPLDPQDIAEAILSLLSDRVLYARCSQNARDAVRLKYNWMSEEKKLLDLYERLFSGHTNPTGS